MKAFLALLASTSMCFAASVGVSNDQLRSSGQKVPAHMEDQVMPHNDQDEPEAGAPDVWLLEGTYIRKDGTPDGVAVSRPIAAFPNKEECDKAVHDYAKEASEHHVTLSCKQDD